MYQKSFMRITSDYSPRFDIVATEEQPLNILCLKYGEQIEPKSIEIGKYIFEPTKRFTQIGSKRFTSAGFFWATCSEGYENQYEGMVEDWLLFSAFYRGKLIPPFPPKLIETHQSYHWAMKQLNENTCIVFNRIGAGRLILLD